MYKIIKTKTATGSMEMAWYESTEKGSYELMGKKQVMKPMKQNKIVFYYRDMSVVKSIINKG